MASESKGTVLIALGANAFIAIIKGVAGAITGSSALLAEAAHSVGDTLNEVFLLTSLRRGARPSDPTHPFGYGKERFFWSLLAAVGIFVAGAVFSLYEGITALFEGGNEESSYLIGYAVLAVALVLEGTSLTRAVRQTRGEAHEAHRGFFEHVRLSSDPTVKTVVSEDTAAVIGIFLAAGGLGLHELTGNAIWDALAAIAIGILLIVVAFLLGRDTKELLIGEAADPKTRVRLYEDLAAYPEVDSVIDVMTMLLGPERLLVAARIDLADDLDGGQVEDFSTRVEADLKRDHANVATVFLDATSAKGEDLERARRLAQEVRRLRATAKV